MCILCRERLKKREWFKQMIQTDDLLLQLATTGVWWQIDGLNILNCDFYKVIKITKPFILMPSHDWLNF